ncbi:MAG: efflux RND transporter periplasmic adaptor subunit, partial [Bacteroidota bacterium]
IETETHHNVFSVPIQSVTVRMPKMEDKPEELKEGEAQLVMKKSKVKEEDKLEEVVFVVDNGTVKTVKVKRGISDDSYVEVFAENLDGKEIVSGPFKAINRELENESKVRVETKPTMRTGAVASAEKK